MSDEGVSGRYGKMAHDTETVRADFDRIARLVAEDEDRLSPYEHRLLDLLPETPCAVLDVGCGTGVLTRYLARRGHRVTAIDLSPQMIAVARERTPPGLDVSYRTGELLETSFETSGFDCVISVATLHHMDRDSAVRRMKSLVGDGGLLVLHDLRADSSLADFFRLPLAVAARYWDVVRGRQRRARAAVRAAWKEHGRDEEYETIRDVRQWARDLLPGAHVVRHLQWRYTVIWRRPSVA